MNRVTIAVASPGDVPQERQAPQKTFTKWNDDNPEFPPLHPKMWEFATPEMGDISSTRGYRLVHQSLMDDTVSMLVFNPQNENPFERVGLWDHAP